MCRNCCVDLDSPVVEQSSTSSLGGNRGSVRCSACKTGCYCSETCLRAHENHQQYCTAICSLQEYETKKQLKQCVYGIDSDKLPYKVKRKLVKLVGAHPLTVTSQYPPS